MNWLKNKLLTSSKFLRLLAILLVGFLINWGVVSESDKPKVVETVTLILVGAGGLLIEKKKEEGVKVIQRRRGLKQDGWAGPVTQEDVAPAPFREPVRTQGRGRAGMFLLFLLPAFWLTGCQTPGVTIPVGDPVVTTLPDGTAKVTAASAIKINADVIGDVDSPLFKLTTPKDAAGNFAYTEIPVTISGTTVITRQPMVAQIKTASVWDAFFSGLRKNLDAVGQFGATVFGIGAAEQILSPVGAAAGTAISP